METSSPALPTFSHWPPSRCNPENCVSLIETSASGLSRSMSSSIAMRVTETKSEFLGCNEPDERMRRTEEVARASAPKRHSLRPASSSP